MCTEQHTGREGEDRAWQRRLLPFMVGSVVFLGAVFFVATIWHFHEMQGRLDYPPPDIQKVLKELEKLPDRIKDPEAYRDWHTRTVLESAALNHRYRQNAAVIYSRLWNGYMGFLTGMVLALCGCVFILGKLRESVNFSGEAQQLKWALVTSSPGVVLALAGAVLIGISLSTKVKVETNDVPVYLPQLVQTESPTGQAPGKPPPPVPLGQSGSSAMKPSTPLPDRLKAKIESSAQPSESARPGN